MSCSQRIQQGCVQEGGCRKVSEESWRCVQVFLDRGSAYKSTVVGPRKPQLATQTELQLFQPKSDERPSLASIRRHAREEASGSLITAGCTSNWALHLIPEMGDNDDPAADVVAGCPPVSS